MYNIPAAVGVGASSGGGGGTAHECKLQFTAVPSGKALAIEHVACNLRLGGDVLTNISLATASGINDSRLVPLEPTPVSQATYNYYSVNDASTSPAAFPGSLCAPKRRQNCR